MSSNHVVHVDLREGWDGDLVQVSIDGQIRFEQRVTTRLQIGLADSFTVNVDRESVHVLVRVPDRGSTASREIRLAAEHWIGIGLDAQGRIELVDQPAPFGYV